MVCFAKTALASLPLPRCVAPHHPVDTLHTQLVVQTNSHCVGQLSGSSRLARHSQPALVKVLSISVSWFFSPSVQVCLYLYFCCCVSCLLCMERNRTTADIVKGVHTVQCGGVYFYSYRFFFFLLHFIFIHTCVDCEGVGVGRLQSHCHPQPPLLGRYPDWVFTVCRCFDWGMCMLAAWFSHLSVFLMGSMSNQIYWFGLYLFLRKRPECMILELL